MENRTDIIANRLRLLRKNSGLSTAKLAEALDKKYKGAITEQTIKSYEARNSSSKYKKNLGMSIERLIMFAEFYNVSADYILGLDDDPSREPVATKELGLSPLAVRMLSDNTRISNEVREGLNALFQQAQFEIACRYIGEMIHLTSNADGMLSRLLNSKFKGDKKIAESMLSSEIKRSSRADHPGLGTHIEVLIGDQQINYMNYLAMESFSNAISKILKKASSNELERMNQNGID